MVTGDLEQAAQLKMLDEHLKMLAQLKMLERELSLAPQW